MSKKEHTLEQSTVVDYACTQSGILLVPAGAGCGKTYISTKIIERMDPKKALYTAFNKAIVEESIEKFRGTNVESRTLHALAKKYVNPKGKIEQLSYNCIKEKLTYPEKAEVLKAIDLFFVSDSTDMYEYFSQFFGDDLKLAEICVSYVVKMLEEEIPCTFNFMLKYFHLQLFEGLKCSYDIVILDEINDTTAVALEIFKLIDAPIKIGLGESNQAIYHFLNLKDGFVELSDAKKLPLTNSFRCSKPIADSLQTFMRTWVDHEFTFTGTSEPVQNGKTLHVTMTNSSIIMIINDFIRLNKGFTLLRKISEIFAYPMAIIRAAGGKEVYQYQYKFLEKEYKKYKKTSWQKMTFFTYLLQTVEDQETEAAIGLIMVLKGQNINLFDLYNKAKEAKPDPKNTIATVFTSKGLEFETVYMNSDFNSRIKKVIENGGIQTEEDLVLFRCYYVAASRAGVNLYDAKYLQ
jgi:hypothetical protein